MTDTRKRRSCSEYKPSALLSFTVPLKWKPVNITYIVNYTPHITRLQHIQNSLAHAVVKAPKSCHISPILRSLHWLKITKCIEYKLLSLTYKFLAITKPSYLEIISVQPPCSTCSSSFVTLAGLSTSSSVQITDCSFWYASPYLWNQLPPSLTSASPHLLIFLFLLPSLLLPRLHLLSHHL